MRVALLLCALMSGLMWACSLEKQANPVVEDTQVVTVAVSGMTWPDGWIPRVHKALEALPWVRDVKVAYEKNEAQVVVEAKRYKPQELLDALEKAGFNGSLAGTEKVGAVMTPSSAVTFQVIGMMKTKSGATWMGWPDKVTEALEGSHATSSLSWDYTRDELTIRYDAKRTSAAELAEVIAGVGYQTKRVEKPLESKADSPATLVRAPLPDGAPKFFRDALEAAREAGRPVLIDFWAEWCGPCKRLKSETLAHPDVAKLLRDIEVVFVDLDKHPELAGAYGVVSVPDVFFVDKAGVITDRLRKFESAADFERRLKSFWRKAKE